jgi:hypothetical protein
VLGYVDEVWWSRLAQPNMHAWSFDQPLRLVEQPMDKDDQQPKALACYGVWLPEQQNMLLRFVEGRPLSWVTCRFLDWVCQRLEQKGKRVWALVWDNASWHISQQVQTWIDKHNKKVKQMGGVRIIVCLLPVKSPWLNRAANRPIEPKWLHGKRAVVEPGGKPSKEELIERVYHHYDCQKVEPLAQKTA